MLIRIVLLSALLALPVAAQWQAPVNLGTNVNSADDEFRAAVTSDGSTLYFDSDRPGGAGDFDIWTAADAGGSWGSATVLGGAVNTSGRDYCPSLSADDQTLYLTTNSWQIASSAWSGSAWGSRSNVPGSVNSGSEEWAAFPSPDGTKLYFAAWQRSGGQGGHDIWVSTWSGSSWGSPSSAGANINDSDNQYTGSISPDGLKMYLSIDGDIYVSDYSGGAWQTPVSLGATVNDPDAWDTNPVIAADGYTLYFSSDRAGGEGGYDLYVTTSVDPTGVADGSDNAPATNRMLSPAPNPFNPTTAIRFELRTEQRVSLQIIDIRGRIVSTMIDEVRSAGSHAVSWHGKDSNGSAVASGVYFAKVTTSEFNDIKRMVLIR